MGVRVVKGSNSDIALITEEASKADVILNAADADDLELTKAVLAGAKQTTTGKRPILIHTSGTGVASAEPTGSFNPGQKVYNVSGFFRGIRIQMTRSRTITLRISSRFPLLPLTAPLTLRTSLEISLNYPND